jgi:probable HAF family extracellular repeat protein
VAAALPVLILIAVLLLRGLGLSTTPQPGAPPPPHRTRAARVVRAKFITINDPMGVKGTSPHGINAQGDIVGYYTDSAGHDHGFLRHRGTYTTLDDPLAVSGPNGGTAAFGIDAQGAIVGTYTDSKGIMRGYLLRQG